jgi:hypothetical protein
MTLPATDGGHTPHVAPKLTIDHHCATPLTQRVPQIMQRDVRADPVQHRPQRGVMSTGARWINTATAASSPEATRSVLTH